MIFRSNGKSLNQSKKGKSGQKKVFESWKLLQPFTTFVGHLVLGKGLVWGVGELEGKELLLGKAQGWEG